MQACILSFGAICANSKISLNPLHLSVATFFSKKCAEVAEFQNNSCLYAFVSKYARLPCSTTKNRE